MENLLNIGFINNVRGLKGEIKVTHYCDYKEMFSSVSYIYIDSVKYETEYVKYHKETVILKLKGIDRVEDAQAFKGKDIYTAREILPELSEGQHYIADLIGLTVYTDKDELVGEVADVINSLASDLLKIKKQDGKEALVPNIKNFVKSISLSDKKIIITPIDGLI